ncbi:hypothetical protein VTK26DRAFT_2441 [Humicola hyalothermophila]
MLLVLPMPRRGSWSSTTYSATLTRPSKAPTFWRLAITRSTRSSCRTGSRASPARLSGIRPTRPKSRRTWALSLARTRPLASPRSCPGSSRLWVKSIPRSSRGPFSA